MTLVNAGQECLDALLKHFLCKLRGGLFPQGKEQLEGQSGEHLFPISAHIFKEDIPEGKAAALQGAQDCSEAAGIERVGREATKAHDNKR
jgi:hypothetical protein